MPLWERGLSERPKNPSPVLKVPLPVADRSPEDEIELGLWCKGKLVAR